VVICFKQLRGILKGTNEIMLGLPANIVNIRRCAKLDDFSSLNIDIYLQLCTYVLVRVRLITRFVFFEGHRY